MQYRRQVIASAAALTAAAISDFSYASYARLEYTLRRGRMALTASDGDHLQAETQRLYERETLVPASVLAPEVETHLATLSGLLALPLGDSLRRVVALCASETALLACPRRSPPQQAPTPSFWRTERTPGSCTS